MGSKDEIRHIERVMHPSLRKANSLIPMHYNKVSTIHQFSKYATEQEHEINIERWIGAIIVLILKVYSFS